MDEILLLLLGVADLASHQRRIVAAVAVERPYRKLAENWGTGLWSICHIVLLSEQRIQCNLLSYMASGFVGKVWRTEVDFVVERWRMVVVVWAVVVDLAPVLVVEQGGSDLCLTPSPTHPSAL